MSVSVQATFCATLVDEWSRQGVTDAVVCPGSRSTPLALALAERLTVHVRLDERSAAFYALGLAMATGRPTVICTTSGTAAVELHPAVVEAHHGHVPLVVCTADRPPELQQVGAPQTVDQVGLFGSAIRWAADPGVPDESQQATWRPMAARAVAEATAGPLGPGPVHLNLAFREPLTGDPGPLPARPAPTISGTTGAAADAPDLDGRGLLVAGAGATRHPERLLALGRALGWPVLADPRSGCRLPGTVAAADAVVRTERPLPACIVVLGAPWLSKALAAYVEAAALAGARVIAVDPWWQWTDPARVVSQFHHGDPDQFIEQAMAAAPASLDGAWLAGWMADEARAQAAIEATLGRDLNEPGVARLVAGHAAERGATIVVSASMPMRDLEWYSPALAAPPRVLANRGANGIDGVVSTAFGVAASGVPTVALLGDLAFLHDVSGLVNLDQHSPCTFVVLDNGGGGIFSFLPQADALVPTRFEQLFGTPPTSDVAAVARGFGLTVHEVDDPEHLAAALGHIGEPGPSLIRVRVPSRADNVVLHEAINEAVRVALA